MTTNKLYRKWISALMAAVVLVSAAVPASAAELTEETQPRETEETAATVPSETAGETLPEVTEPEETTVPTESVTVPTEPAETIQPTEETTVPTELAETTQPTESTTAPTEPEEIPEPTETVTVPTETTVPLQKAASVTIAEAKAMTSGEELLAIQGTVVYASGTQAVLQDETGGIRLVFGEDPGAALGDVLDVMGTCSGGFFVTEHVFAGTGELPAVETTLYDAPETLRVVIRNAAISADTLTQSGTSISLVATIPAGTENMAVDVYGVILDGRFYADTIAPGTAAVMALSEEPADYHLYFGQLHAHTELSGSYGSVREAFSYASNVEGLDFFAVTDHSHSLDNAKAGSITSAVDAEGNPISQEWMEGKAAAAAVTDEDFVGIFGYEMSWEEIDALGHISTFNTPGWQTRDQVGFDTLQGYYDALLTVPDSISQFNHPGQGYGDFEAFGHYSEDYDQVIHLLEVGSEGVTAYEKYTEALDQGWHLAPTNNQNNHHGSWGDESDVRTVILAEKLTEESLFEAIRSYRVYATEDRDLAIRYELNGAVMGSTIGESSALEVSLKVEDPTDSAIGTVEVIVDGGQTVAKREIEGTAASMTIDVPTNYNYYYLRFSREDKIIAVTAPVWVDHYEDMGITGLTADIESPAEGETVSLTLNVYNHESVDFVVQSVEFSAGSMTGSIPNPETVPAKGDAAYEFSLTFPATEELQITATVTGTVEGVSRSYTQPLTLHRRIEEGAPVSGFTIAQVRMATPGTSYRIEGYVTAGNENPYNTFPDTLYLQDASGGIALKGSVPEDVAVDDYMRATGVLMQESGNWVLKLTEYALTGKRTQPYTPSTLPNAVATNYSINGGELLQIEGKVVSLTPTSDGKGVSRFTIEDTRGVLATVVVESCIRSGAIGLNTLASRVKKDRTVRVIGLLHMDEYGTAVLRVRDCDEVISVQSVADPTNPKTGDRFWFRK